MANNLYTIKTITMFKHLCNKGIYPIQIDPNIFKPNFVVWKYENTNELHKAMQEFRK